MSDDDDTFDVSPHSQLAPLPPVPPNQGPQSMLLATLLDFAIQKTYHELTVKTQLLPSMSDLDRKIEIVQFAHKTRQLFIRLLAIVKWAKSAAKVDICTAISCFLNQQCSYFVDSADYLFQLSKEVLTTARLPAFQIPAAVDVLTLGTYPRLPVCLKTRFVPDDPISSKEQACVLQRLNQVIRYRLISNANSLPAHYTVKNGIVKFFVENEFEASLTLIGEAPDTPWTLLNLKILVQDYEIGEGQDLVHPLQIHYLHQVVQARIEASTSPLVELYEILHIFCLSVQLDILHCQASKLIHERLNDNITITEYQRGHRLTVSYWKNLSGPSIRRPTTIGTAATSGLSYKLIVDVHQTAGRKYLRVSHVPSADSDLPSLLEYDRLSLENLLSDTQTRRVRYRLSQIKERIENIMPFVKCRSSDGVPQLEVELLENSSDTEKLFVTVNLFSGRFFCTAEQIETSHILEDLTKILNAGQWSSLKQFLVDIRITLFVNRCRKSVINLPVQVCGHLSFAPGSSIIRSLSKHRLFLRFSRYENYLLVLQFLANEKNEIKINYYLLSISSQNLVASTKEENVGVCSTIKASSMIELDKNMLKKYSKDERKRPKIFHDSNFLTELSTILSICDQRIPFMLLCEQFDKKCVKYQTLYVEENVDCNILKILGFNKLGACCSKELADKLFENVISCNFRLLNDKNRLNWSCEILFANVPVKINQKPPTTNVDSSSTTIRLCTRTWPVTSDGAVKCVDEFLSTICMFSHMDDLVRRFAPVYESTSLRDYIELKNYSYYKLIFAYGPKKSFVASVEWRCQENLYHLSLAVYNNEKSSNVDNPSGLTIHFLQNLLNETKDLSYLTKILHETCSPLLSLQQLPQLPVQGAFESTPSMPQILPYCHTFAVLPVSEISYRIFYRWNFCLELMCLNDGLIAVRDAKSSFSAQITKITNRFAPIIGLKAFLNLHEKLIESTCGFEPIDDDAMTKKSQMKDFSDIGKPISSPAKSMHDLKLFSPASVSAPSPAVAVPPSPMTMGSAATPAPPSNQPNPNPSPAPQAVTSQNSVPAMTPSPAPPSNAGLFTPSPAPLSNAGMLLTPSPAQVPQASPAPFASSQSVQSPGGQVQSPISAISALNEFAALTNETKMSSIEFPNSWSEISGPPSAPQPMEKETSRMPSISSAPPSVSKPQSSTTTTTTNGNLDLTPNSDVTIIHQATLMAICSKKDKDLCPLLKFFGSVSLFERLYKQQTGEKTNSNSVLTNGQIVIKMPPFDCRFYLDDVNLTALRLKVTDVSNENWSIDDQRTIEQYFSTYVASTYNPNALTSFLRLILFSRTAHHTMLKDVLSLMKHQLNPEQGVPWHFSLCMTMPPPNAMTPPIFSFAPNMNVQPGSVAIITSTTQGNKLLFWIKLTSVSNSDSHVILPLRYDGDKNEIQVYTVSANVPQQGNQAALINSVNQCLLTQTQAYQAYNDCCLWPAVRGLLHNLQMPAG